MNECEQCQKKNDVLELYSNRIDALIDENEELKEEIQRLKEVLLDI